MTFSDIEIRAMWVVEGVMDSGGLLVWCPHVCMYDLHHVYSKSRTHLSSNSALAMISPNIKTVKKNCSY
jgi:hypothetical protein